MYSFMEEIIQVFATYIIEGKVALRPSQNTSMTSKFLRL